MSRSTVASAPAPTCNPNRFNDGVVLLVVCGSAGCTGSMSAASTGAASAPAKAAAASLKPRSSDAAHQGLSE